MPIRIVQPNSNQQCIEFLNKVVAQAKLQKGKFNMARPWFNRSEELLGDFVLGRTKILETYQTLVKDRRRERLCAKQLQMLVRDFDAVLYKRVMRGGGDTSIFPFYKMPTQRGLPSAKTTEGWRVLAEDRIQGDVRAAAEGFEAMANPSTADLQACVDESLLLEGQVELADREYQQAQREMETLRNETMIVWRILQATIQALTPELSYESQRRLLRSFGYRYRVVKDKPKSSTTTSTNGNTQPNGQNGETQNNTQTNTNQNNENQNEEAQAQNQNNENENETNQQPQENASDPAETGEPQEAENNNQQPEESQKKNSDKPESGEKEDT